MRVYVPNTEYHFKYPGEMKRILEYLNKNGKLYVSPKIVESYYCDFSSTYAAGWLIVNEKVLEEFADYLSKIEV